MKPVELAGWILLGLMALGWIIAYIKVKLTKRQPTLGQNGELIRVIKGWKYVVITCSMILIIVSMLGLAVWQMGEQDKVYTPTENSGGIWVSDEHYAARWGVTIPTALVAAGGFISWVWLCWDYENSRRGRKYARG